MEMAYRDRWKAEIAAMRRVLAGLAMTEECKWGKPTYTVDGKNIVIMQGFKEYFALGFFQGALLKDPKKVLVQLGQLQAGRVTLRKDSRFKRSFDALTPGRQRSYLYHFAAAKQSATRVARIERAMPAILEGRGFLERR